MKTLNNWMARNLNYCFIKVLPRHSVRFAKDYFKGREITVAEVGVANGENAWSMIENLNIKRLFLIDIKKKIDWDFGNKIFLEMTSDEAVNKIPLCDFIYIDGDHSYEQAKKDMVNYWKKLRKGGILAGHDIVGYKGVTKAFMEFCYENKLEPNISRTDWWVVKE